MEAGLLPPPRDTVQKQIDEFLQANAPITDPALLAKYQAMIRKINPTTYGMVAGQARMLRQSLDEFPSLARQHWAEAWQGDKELSFEKVCSILDDVIACFDRLDAEALETFRIQAFPEPPRKRGARTAQRVYFDRILKKRFKTEFGHLFPRVIGTLEQVMYDLPDAVDESTVLKR